jgi:glycosyltransferase involved in cell wall biosynthesis
MFRVVINCGPAEAYIAKCLASLRSQTFTQWNAYVTVDPCGDRTFEEAVAAGAGDARIDILRNAERRYSMVNLICAIARSAAAPEDVIVILDGDDWFATPDALRIIHDTYRQTSCWMTYGSWVADQPGLAGSPRGGRWPAYSLDTTDFRRSPWLGTAVRTWKRWLWDRIDDRDFRDSQGNYFRVTEDQAAMMPMLEMSGPAKASHIADVLMVYNRSSPHGCGLTCEREMFRNAAYLSSLTPYSRLLAKPAPILYEAEASVCGDLL